MYILDVIRDSCVTNLSAKKKNVEILGDFFLTANPWYAEKNTFNSSIENTYFLLKEKKGEKILLLH